MQNFFAKITVLNQYDPTTSTLTWQDPTPERWEKVYGKLEIGDRGFILGQGVVYSGLISIIEDQNSISFANVETFNLKADRFLSIDAVSPELNAQLKGAIGQPYIFEEDINFDAFRQAALTRDFINFFIVKSETVNNNSATFRNNDRVITINEDLVFENFGVYNNGNLVPILQNQSFFNVKGKSIYDVIQIFEEVTARKSITTTSSNLNLLNRILQNFESGNTLYQFPSFSGYYNIIHNKTALVYSKIQLVNYYAVGSIWDGHNPKEQKDRFLKDGIWKNGYDDKYLDLVKSVSVGSKIAIKAAHTQNNPDIKNKKDSVMTIKARGEVVGNTGDGKTLSVKWENDFTPFRVPFSGGYWDTISKVNKTEHIKAIFYNTEDIGEEDDIIIDDKNDKLKFMNNTPRNIILYGPPGTGKTYNTIDLAVELSTGSKHKDHNVNKEEFNDLVKAGQVEFITFHQNYSYEDFVIGIKPDLQSSADLKFKRNEGILYRMAKKAEKNYLQSKKEAPATKEFEQVFNEFLTPLIESGKEIEVKMASGKASFWITDINPNNLGFRKQSGGTTHTLSIDTIRELYEGKRNFSNGLRYYYQPLLNILWEQGKQNAVTPTLNNYVLIIDEINRANISRVFGELITLLEEDKRLGSDNELALTLPNGEENFSLPPNLFILGTMNTADKSIALVDIALRRRFDFRGFYPTKSVVSELASKNLLHIDAPTILNAINDFIYEKKGADYLIGHAYFINKISDPDLDATLRRKVIPLLMEYFSGKTKIVEESFDKSGYTVSYNREDYDWVISKG